MKATVDEALKNLKVLVRRLWKPREL